MATSDYEYRFVCEYLQAAKDRKKATKRAFLLAATPKNADEYGDACADLETAQLRYDALTKGK